MLLILLVILAVSLTVSLIYIAGVRKAYTNVLADRDNYVQQLITSQQQIARIETECNFLKITIADILKRPAIATISEENMHQLAGFLESIFAPERMN